MWLNKQWINKKHFIFNTTLSSKINFSLNKPLNNKLHNLHSSPHITKEGGSSSNISGLYSGNAYMQTVLMEDRGFSWFSTVPPEKCYDTKHCVEWLAPPPLSCQAQPAFDSWHSQDTQRFIMVFLRTSRQCPGQYLKTGHDYLVIQNYPPIWQYIYHAIKRVLLNKIINKQTIPQ